MHALSVFAGDKVPAFCAKVHCNNDKDAQRIFHTRSIFIAKVCRQKSPTFYASDHHEFFECKKCVSCVAVQNSQFLTLTTELDKYLSCENGPSFTAWETLTIQTEIKPDRADLLILPQYHHRCPALRIYFIR